MDTEEIDSEVHCGYKPGCRRLPDLAPSCPLGVIDNDTGTAARRVVLIGISELN